MFEIALFVNLVLTTLIFGGIYMSITFDLLEDKVEFFESNDLKSLEKAITRQIDTNKALMLKVHSISHQVCIDSDGRPHYTAMVHFKLASK